MTNRCRGKLRDVFPEDIIVDHVQLKDWEGIRNGELLKRAAADGYDALISADKNMSYQQNDQALLISVVILHVDQLRIVHLELLIKTALKELRSVSVPTFIRVDSEQINNEKNRKT